MSPGSEARSYCLKARSRRYPITKMFHRDAPADYKCLKCSAHYKVVRARAEPRSPNWQVHCKVCKEPLASMEGEDILKYFLTARPRAVRH